MDVKAVGPLDGDGYEAWVAGLDPLSREPRGRLRQDPSAVRFVEVVVNGPKTWSLAAALDPGIAEAYDAAQGRASQQIIGWLAQHTTTRIGPRGRQVQVPVERIEAATVRHYTSRAGDPHRHLHLQINARVWAGGKWRGLHTVGVRDMIDATNGIGHAAVMCDPQFRRALADRGFTLDSQTGDGAQGETTRTAHLALGEHTGAASAYVAMTRGREANTAHLVAEDLEDARQQWTLAFARNRTDLGPAHAARLAAQEAAKYEPYFEPHHLDNYDDPAPVSGRRPEPIPTSLRPPGAGPGIGF